MITETVMIHALDIHMTKKKEIEIEKVFTLMIEPMANNEEAIVNEKVQDDLDMIDDEEYEILQMFTKDNVIDVEGCVAKTESLAIRDDVMTKRLEGVDNLENEVCSLKSLNMKKRMVENMASMAHARLGLR